MRMKWMGLVGVFALATASPVASQHGPSPYAGFDARPIKALSPQQVDELRAGKGMGLALAAELNGYPGPLHVVELADRLGLSESQRQRVEALLAAVKGETIPLGERLIEAERHLDRLFAERSVTPESLAAATRTIGELQAALRAAHLKYHLLTAEILSKDQIRRYAELRGYGGHPHGGAHGGQKAH